VNSEDGLRAFHLVIADVAVHSLGQVHPEEGRPLETFPFLLGEGEIEGSEVAVSDVRYFLALLLFLFFRAAVDCPLDLDFLVELVNFAQELAGRSRHDGM
jgi:hypothetical protein